MALLTIDIDDVEDFYKVLRSAETVCWVDTQSQVKDKLFIVPTAPFPATYQCWVEKDSWKAHKANFQFIPATLEVE